MVIWLVWLACFTAAFLLVMWVLAVADRVYTAEDDTFAVAASLDSGPLRGCSCGACDAMRGAQR